MKKLFSEEIIDLKTGLSKYLLLTLLFSLQEIIFPQIPFKGFGKINTYHFDADYNRVASINYDNDEYSDLLIFNPLIKKAKLYNGISGAEFKLDREINLPGEISELHPIINQNNMIEEYAFSSRKGRQFGLLKFSKNGNVELLKKIQFDYYPENVSVSYNYLTQENEFLLSGTSFNGVSVLSISNGRLFERKITDKSAFKIATFIDLNSDGSEDFIAIDAIENKLHFFYRNSKNEFEDLRSYSFDEEIFFLQVFDFNYDGYKDIILSTGNSIEILFGDARSAYKKSVNISINYSADKFVIGDYNRDGYFDIIYANKVNGIISSLFAKNFETFYSELIHYKDNYITDLIPFYSKFVYGCAFLNSNGDVRILSKINSLSEDQQIAIGVNPDLLVTFDYLDNGLIDFAFTNDQNKNLNIILRDAAGLPEILYSIYLYGEHTELKICNISSTVKCFYLFNKTKREVEALEIDLKNYSYKRNFYYAQGSIEDVLIKRDYKNEPQVNILFNDNGKLALQSQYKIEDKTVIKTYPNLEKNWSDAYLISNKEKSIVYQQKSNFNLTVKNLTAEDKIYKTILSENFVDQSYFSIGKQKINAGNKSDEYFVLLFSKDKMYFFVDGNTYLNDKIDKEKGLRITDKNQLFFGKNNSVFISENHTNSFYQLRLNDKAKTYKMDKVLSDVYIKNFVVDQLEPRSNNLIFTNSKESILEIRHLPK